MGAAEADGILSPSPADFTEAAGDGGGTLAARGFEKPSEPDRNAPRSASFDESFVRER
jgi:hypothetical protein